MHPYTKLKEEQKTRAESIRNGKSVRKPHMWEEHPERHADANKLYRNRYDFRHWHIARCELKGLKREQIERPAEDNKPNKDYIEKLKDQIREEVADYEDVRNCA